MSKIEILMGNLYATRTIDEGYAEVRAFMANRGTHVGHVAMLPNVEPPVLRISTVIPDSTLEIPVRGTTYGLETLRSEVAMAEFLGKELFGSGGGDTQAAG